MNIFKRYIGTSFPQFGEPYYGGGAFFCSEFSELNITNCEFTSNVAAASVGGALYVIGAAGNRANFDTQPGLIIKVCST